AAAFIAVGVGLVLLPFVLDALRQRGILPPEPKTRMGKIARMTAASARREIARLQIEIAQMQNLEQLRALYAEFAAALPEIKNRDKALALLGSLLSAAYRNTSLATGVFTYWPQVLMLQNQAITEYFDQEMLQAANVLAYAQDAQKLSAQYKFAAPSVRAKMKSLLAQRLLSLAENTGDLLGMQLGIRISLWRRILLSTQNQWAGLSRMQKIGLFLFLGLTALSWLGPQFLPDFLAWNNAQQDAMRLGSLISGIKSLREVPSQPVKTGSGQQVQARRLIPGTPTAIAYTAPVCLTLGSTQYGQKVWLVSREHLPAALKAKADARAEYFLVDLENPLEHFVPLGEKRFIIGRKSPGSIPWERTVSRMHAYVSALDSHIVVEHLSDTNYTYVMEDAKPYHDAVAKMEGREVSGPKPAAAAPFKAEAGELVKVITSSHRQAWWKLHRVLPDNDTAVVISLDGKQQESISLDLLRKWHAELQMAEPKPELLQENEFKVNNRVWVEVDGELVEWVVKSILFSKTHLMVENKDGSRQDTVSVAQLREWQARAKAGDKAQAAPAEALATEVKPLTDLPLVTVQFWEEKPVQARKLARNSPVGIPYEKPLCLHLGSLEFDNKVWLVSSEHLPAALKAKAGTQARYFLVDMENPLEHYIPLGGKRLAIGRADRDRIPWTNAVSKMHAYLTVQDDYIILEHISHSTDTHVTEDAQPYLAAVAAISATAAEEEFEVGRPVWVEAAGILEEWAVKGIVYGKTHLIVERQDGVNKTVSVTQLREWQARAKAGDKAQAAPAEAPATGFKPQALKAGDVVRIVLPSGAAAQWQVRMNFPQEKKAWVQSFSSGEENIVTYDQLQEWRQDKGKKTSLEKSQLVILSKAWSENRAPQLPVISEPEALRVLAQSEVHGSVKVNGDKLTPGQLERLGLQPRYRISIPGQHDWYVSQLYDLGQERVAVVAYVWDQGHYVTRSYYLSNSHAEWRYLPYVLMAEGSIQWYGKGYDENSIKLPNTSEKALNDLLASTRIATLASQDEIDLAFAGTARSLELMPGTTYVKETPLAPRRLLAAADREPGKKMPPEKAVCENPRDNPDFDNMISQYYIKNGFHGTVQVRVFPSLNQELIYTFKNDIHGRVWVSVETTAAVNSLGVRSEWVDAGPIATPADSYLSEAGDYGDISKAKGPYVDMWKNYNSRIPILAAFHQRFIQTGKKPGQALQAVREVSGVILFHLGLLVTALTVLLGWINLHYLAAATGSWPAAALMMGLLGAMTILVGLPLLTMGVWIGLTRFMARGQQMTPERYDKLSEQWKYGKIIDRNTLPAGKRKSNRIAYYDKELDAVVADLVRLSYLPRLMQDSILRHELYDHLLRQRGEGTAYLRQMALMPKDLLSAFRRPGPAAARTPWLDFKNIRVSVAPAEHPQGVLGRLVSRTQSFTLNITGKPELAGMRYDVEGKTYIQYGDRWAVFDHLLPGSTIPLEHMLDSELLIGNPSLQAFLGIEKLTPPLSTRALPAGVQPVTELKGIFTNEYTSAQKQAAIRLLQNTSLLDLAKDRQLTEQGVVDYLDALAVVSHKNVSAYKEFVSAVSNLDMFSKLIPQLNIRIHPLLQQKIRDTIDFAIKRKMTYPKPLMDVLKEKPHLQRLTKTAADQHQTILAADGSIRQIDSANNVNWADAMETGELLAETDRMAGQMGLEREEYLKFFQYMAEIGIAGEGRRILENHFRINKMFGRMIPVKKGMEKQVEAYFLARGFKHFELVYQGDQAYVGITHLVLARNPNVIIIAGLPTIEPSEEWLGEIKDYLILTQDITNTLDEQGRILEELVIAGHGRLVILMMEEKEQLEKLLEAGLAWRHVQGDDLGNALAGALMSRQIKLGHSPFIVLTTPQKITTPYIENMKKIYAAFQAGKDIVHNGQRVAGITWKTGKTTNALGEEVE
ncbi:hypothetical protein JW933_00610, partial [candidate division FCPU426 bacterium]|nr:hypothetical protein [candidate division FCPU426 bacterium]